MNWVKLQARLFLFIKGVLVRTTLGARGVLIEGDKVLLIRHTYVPGWQLPGGGVDPGETVREAFRREVFEETGYRVNEEGSLVHLYHNDRATNRDHVALFTATEFHLERAFTPSREIAEMGWFDHKKLPADTTECTRQRIDEVFGDVPIRDKW